MLSGSYMTLQDFIKCNFFLHFFVYCLFFILDYFTFGLFEKKYFVCFDNFVRSRYAFCTDDE